MSNRTTKQASTRTDAQRTDRLYKAIDLFEHSPELAKRVYHLGTPTFTNCGSTASVAVTPEGRPVFQFHRDYFDGLDGNQLVFVVLHEALHFALCHPQRRHGRSVALWNIACDLVANDFLLKKAGFEKLTDRSFREFLDAAVTFENLPIAPADERPSLTAEEAYDLLAMGLQKVHGDTLSLEACDEHKWSEFEIDAVPELSEPIDRFAEQVQQIFREWLPAWGDEPLAELRAIGEIPEPIGFSWDSVLSRRIASCIQLAAEERWAPPNRKIAWLYPRVLLPTDREVEYRQLSVLIAIDASGSVSQPVLNGLVGLARSIPTDRVELTTISFDTKVYPVDIWERTPGICGGGGTSFDGVETFAQRLSQYPDLVVVLTDGFASRPAVQHPDRWFWLITEEGTTEHIDGIGQYCMIGSAALLMTRPRAPKSVK